LPQGGRGVVADFLVLERLRQRRDRRLAVGLHLPERLGGLAADGSVAVLVLDGGGQRLHRVPVGHLPPRRRGRPPRPPPDCAWLPSSGLSRAIVPGPRPGGFASGPISRSPWAARGRTNRSLPFRAAVSAGPAGWASAPASASSFAALRRVSASGSLSCFTSASM